MVAEVTARQAARSGLLWGAVFAAYLAASALGYATTYRSTAQRAALVRTFGANVGVNALVGPAHRIDTVAGFTAWRSLGVLGVVGAVWGLFAGTRLLRGEEEAGRWEVLLAGPTTRGGAAAQALAGLAIGLAVLYAVPAVVLVAVGRSATVGFAPSAGLFDVLVVVSAAAVFLAAGAFASQLAPTRRRATAYAATALGVAYGLRMVADSGTSLDWMRWTTPLGWIEEARPLTGSRPWALLPSGAVVATLAVASVWLAGRRDLGASTVPDRPNAAARTRLLGGPTGLTVRLARPTLAGWALGIAVAGVVTGLISKSAGQAMASASAFQRALARLGAVGLGARAYLGVVYLILALLVALIAAGQVNAARQEEAEGRLEHLLVRSTTRATWLLGRVTTTWVALVVAALLAAAFTWVGAASQDAGVGITRLLAAGVNLVPPAIVVLGAGTLALGLRPRSVAAVTYGVLAWSFLVELVGSVVNASHWLLDTSVLHHMAPAPATNPNWRGNLVLLAIGVAATLIGLAGFVRRDITGE